MDEIPVTAVMTNGETVIVGSAILDGDTALITFNEGAGEELARFVTQGMADGLSISPTQAPTTRSET